MAQVNQNAWAQGSQMYRDSLDRERQADIDAMTAKRFGWDEEKVNRERSAFDETQRIGQSQREALMAESPQATPYGAGGYLGEAAPDAAYGPPAIAANPTLRNATTPGAGNPMTDNLAQGLKVGMDRLQQQRQQALSAYDMALANNDRQGMLAASGAIQQLNTASQRANIFNTVLSSPDTVRQVADNLTRNPGIALKAQVNEAGVTTLVRDDGYKAEIAPYDMARLAVHMWDMKNGDATALEKIGGINKELAAALKESNATTSALATSSNQGLKLGGDLRAQEANIRQSDAAAGASAASAERSRAVTQRETEDPVQRKIAFMQAAGIQVTPEMQKNLYGLKTGKDNDEAFLQDIAKEMVKNDPSQAAKLPEIMADLRKGFSATKKAPALEGAISRAAAEGKLPEARADWVKKGMDPSKFDELAARVGSAPAAGQVAPAPTTGRIDSTLQRQRDDESRLIKEAELRSAEQRAANGDPRAAADVQALRNELSRMAPAAVPQQRPVEPAAPAPQAPTSRMAPSMPSEVSSAAPVAAPQQRSLAQELGAQGGGGLFDRQADAKAAQIQQASEAVLRARGQLAAVARSGDQRAVQMYTQVAQEAINNYNALIQSMNLNKQVETRVRNNAGM